MISRDKDDKLVRIYFYICDKFKELQFYCERFSNNNESAFTDQEMMTIYLRALQNLIFSNANHNLIGQVCQIDSKREPKY